jgi:ferredoxin-thioredoxin reductase catalytic subunit
VRGSGSARFPPFHPVERTPAPAAEEEEEDRFIGRPCYSFNPQLRPSLNDTRCEHCRFYLTSQCPHIEEFLDDVEDLSPE